MSLRSNTPHWEALKFIFFAANQADKGKTFYIHAFNFFKVIDIDTESEDRTKKDGNNDT